MALTWDEIRKRSVRFAHEWANETRETAEAKSFWDGFFDVFGIRRRRVASFEEPVKLLKNKRGRIDLFWRGTLLVEHKSRGEDLDSAYAQATNYFDGIPDSDLPKYVLVSDFERLRLYDLDEGQSHEFPLSKLRENVRLFSFMLGYAQPHFHEEAPVNIAAAERMGELHDALKDSGYEGHQLEVFLVRIMFCLFADDTSIFERGHFRWLVETRTREDGADLGPFLGHVFQILDTPSERRQRTLDEDLAALPYVNGRLFRERLELPSFDSGSRATLVRCCEFDWSEVSPAVFGSMFQSVMNPAERRNLGAHYTSEKNILKTLRPLVLDGLEREFRAAYRNRRELHSLLGVIANIKILDPACGCGNFLIIAYRELRLLEIRINERIRELDERAGQHEIGVDFSGGIDVDAMAGIEIEEFPAKIAETALWLVDHQMNLRSSEVFGEYFVRLPLRKAPNITHGNALAANWAEYLPAYSATDTRLTRIPRRRYLVGNPPFAGKKRRNPEQVADMEAVCSGIRGAGELDYVACWYIRATELIAGTDIRAAFVSTNSVTQGEQVGLLWRHLLSQGIDIEFAHRTFRWSNEAGGVASVHVVIVGFLGGEAENQRLFDYETPNSEPLEIAAENINPYLVDAPDVTLSNRRVPICEAPRITFGSMPNDDGNLLLTDEEKRALVESEPQARRFIRPLLTASEFLNGKRRWCIWLADVPPSEWSGLQDIRERVERVREFRAASRRAATVALAKVPYLFGERRQPKARYILIPRHSSEHRAYIPMALCEPSAIAGDSCAVVASDDLFHFGILMSGMHMAWVRQVCGRIKSDFRYSNEVVYNNFPWPQSVAKKQVQSVRDAAADVLTARQQFPNQSLAELYSPLGMPRELVAAHARLDRAVERCYRTKAFESDLTRLELLFSLYEEYTADLIRSPTTG